MVCDGHSSAYCKVYDIVGACDGKTQQDIILDFDRKGHDLWYENQERNEVNYDCVHNLYCVCHVQKIMGTALRNWKQQNSVEPWESEKT